MYKVVLPLVIVIADQLQASKRVCFPTYCFPTTCFQPHFFQAIVYYFQHRPFPTPPTDPPTKAAYLDTVFSPDALRNWGGGSDYGDDLAVALEWITTRAKEMQQVCGIVPLGVSRVPHSLGAAAV